MRAASLLWLVVMALAVPSARASSTRVAVGLAHSGTVTGGQTLGANPFVAPPTMSASDGKTHFAARLSGGALPEAMFVSAGSGPADVSLTSGTPSPYGAPYLEFLPPSSCGEWSAFWTRLDAAGDADAAIVARGGSAAIGIARTGEMAPGGGTLAALGATPGMGSDGSVSFLALVDGGPSPALFLRDAGGTLTRLLAAENDAPWAAGTTLLDLGAPSRSCAGTLALVVTVLSGGVEQDLLITGPPGGLAPVLASGTAIEGGATIERLLGPAAPGPHDDWFLRALLSPAGAEAVIRVPASGPPELLARSGDPTPVGGGLAGIGPPCAWWPGRAAFRATLASGTGLPAGAVRAALLGTGPTLEAIVTPATSFLPGLMAHDFSDPACIGDGRVAFSTRTSAGRRLAMWSQGTLTSLAASGEISPASGLYLDGGLKTSRTTLLDDGSAGLDARLTSSDVAGALLRTAPGSAPTAWLTPGTAVDGAGVVLTVLGRPAALAAGVVVAATLSVPTPHTAYLHLIEGQPPSILLAVGEPAPTGGSFLSLGPNPAGLGGGAVAFGASLMGGAAPVGLFIRESGGDLRPLAVAGSVTGEAEVLSAFSFAPVPAGMGLVAFRAVTTAGVTGLWTIGSTTGSGPAVAVLRTGQLAPGGGTVVSIDEPTAGPEGSLAVLATLDDGRTTALMALDGTLRRAFTTGDPVGGSAIEALRAVGVDSSGAAIASVTLSGSPRTAVIRESGAGVELLLAGGDPGPETVPGSVLGSFGALATHADGRIAVAADLEGWSRGAAMILVTADGDADGRGDPVDCAPADGSVHAVPGEVVNLRLATAASTPLAPAPALQLSWDEPAQPGGGEMRFDVLAGDLTALRTQPFDDASCARSGLSTPELTMDPALGSGDRWFLVRARNACGSGTVGAAPGRAAVDALSCP